MSADLATFTTSVPTSAIQNPFEAARLALVKRLLEMQAPKAYPTAPSPADHEGIAQHIRDGYAIFDAWLGAVGFQVADNATCNIDMRAFEGAFEAGADNAVYECCRAAEVLRGDREAA